MKPGTVRLTKREERFVRSRDTCRIATVGRNRWPHCVPVGYLYKRGKFYIPADRRSKKASNLRTNRRACIVIDDESTEEGVMIQGFTEIVEDRRFVRIRRWMESRTGWSVGKYPGGAILVLVPLKKVGWRLRP